MIKIYTYTDQEIADASTKKEIIDFLFESLEQYGDPKSDIEKAIDYAFAEDNKPGGVVLSAVNTETKKIAGAVVVNKTGMVSYIPENILVYIATDKNLRGQGIGKQLMQKAIESSEGDIALHCEPDNPAKHLYEKLGFTSKYLEMRLKK
ncbi:GNAT family N-acetyltransferase [Chryseobacterium sp. SNU WT5]|uniref:GNAT family N-acetyltransferase n=1 Tax=Chryseobacterium sp. SNU WT5 TaxID=2594269 RepID=UPI00117E5FBF|nr:GNAT family N-acetyltransferase [Chryseobacterium sp. SNU WT5]QDP86287.1 GNAT family N-acetyltransferase [Chryseobacterium sp. SNU WT5]